MMQHQTPKKILIISLRFLGDVLLTTPLSSALKEKNPEHSIDFLVFKGTEGVLQGNSDLNAILTIPERPSKEEQKALLNRIKNAYDIVIITQTSDKAHWYGYHASHVRYGFIPPKLSHNWWKKLLLKKSLILNDTTHRVMELQRLCQLLGLNDKQAPKAPCIDLAQYNPRLFDQVTALINQAPTAIIHMSPRWRYKEWPLESWVQLVSQLLKDGMRVILSGGPSSEEKNRTEQLLAQMTDDQCSKILNLQGKIQLNELASILKLAQLYVGPDTGTTHLAACSGIKTIALFGPTDPIIWGPYPKNNQSFTAYERCAATQIRGNVYLIQNSHLTCVPCQKEGCDRHQKSHSECLDKLEWPFVYETIINKQ